MAKISVIVTVLNEEATIKRLLDGLINQTLKPNEIIIVDGGSTDNTWSILNKFAPPLRLRGGRGVIFKKFQKPGNRAVGRNYSISQSKSKIIAFTDAGCIPDPDWLAELTKPFSSLTVEVVSGYYRGLSENIFQKCLIPYVLVMPDQIKGEFLPSTRSMAMRKGVGLFDERLNHNEDYAFANTLKKKGIKFYFAQKAVVGWLPRKNLRQAAWMWLRFAIGDVQAGIFRPKVKLIFIRYYLFFFLIFVNYRFGLLVIPYLMWSIFKNFKYVRNIRALYWLPVLQLTADTMVIFGTIMGLLSQTKK